jgi:hypothetical protein
MLKCGVLRSNPKPPYLNHGVVCWVECCSLLLKFLLVLQKAAAAAAVEAHNTVAPFHVPAVLATTSTDAESNGKLCAFLSCITSILQTQLCAADASHVCMLQDWPHPLSFSMQQCVDGEIANQALWHVLLLARCVAMDQEIRCHVLLCCCCSCWR